ncbi:Extracellular solute-binding protein, family 3 [Candidatus Magnetomorum sp. HK-1]|nr:Extracellular solute-binding protein, family 3 [Candidatus Magnetomorum sp. HK-1]
MGDFGLWSRIKLTLRNIAQQDDTIEKCFENLSEKIVDAVLANYHLGSYKLKMMGKKGIVILPKPIKSTNAYITFSKKKKFDFLALQFNKVLSGMKADGTYKKIYDRYTKIE